MATIKTERSEVVYDRRASLPDAKGLTAEEIVGILKGDFRKAPERDGVNPIIKAVIGVRNLLLHLQFPSFPYPPHSIVDSAHTAVTDPSDPTMADYQRPKIILLK